jgi:general secretion pathway protein D
MKKILILLFLVINLFSKDFQSIKLTEFAHIISNTTDKNIVISDTVSKDFSIYLPSFDFQNTKVSLKLLDEILEVNQLSSRQFDNIILIYKELPNENKPDIILNPYVIKYQFLNVKELQPFLTSLYPNIKFSYMKNRVFFSASELEYTIIKEYIETLDKSYLQANIYFNVVSTSNTKAEDVGTDFDFSNTFSKGDLASYLHIMTSGAKFEATLPNPAQFFGFINLMHTKGHSTILQNPSVLVRDGGSALLEASTRIPILQATTSTSSTLNQTQNTYKYEDVGLKLNITDVFITNDVFTFTLEIILESILDKSVTPTISSKKLKTTITLKDNNPFIIAGINAKDDFESTTNIPIIEYIPIVNKITEHKTTDNKNETFTIVLNTDFFKKEITE